MSGKDFDTSVKAGYFHRKKATNSIIATFMGDPDGGSYPLKHPQCMLLPNYLLDKANQNILITGASGQGKTVLTRFLLTHMAQVWSPSQVLIFSFKPHDAHLCMGYPIVRVGAFRPSVFGDPESFVAAWEVAHPFTMRGIQASLVPSLLRSLVESSRSWVEFLEHLRTRMRTERDGNIRSALHYISAKAEILPGVGHLSFHTRHSSPGVVFDLSGMPRTAATFYAEYLLRRTWEDLQAGRRGSTVICVEEAHHLLRAPRREDPSPSVLSVMAREIRSFGRLVLTTQNLTDVPEDERNQYATQFAFRSRHEKDLRAARALNPHVPYALSRLGTGDFVDLQAHTIHSGLYIWGIWRASFVDYPELDMPMDPDLSASQVDTAPPGAWRGTGGMAHTEMVKAVRSHLAGHGYHVDPEPEQMPGLPTPDLRHRGPAGQWFHDEIEMAASHPEQVRKNLRKAGRLPVWFWAPDTQVAARVLGALQGETNFRIFVRSGTDGFTPFEDGEQERVLEALARLGERTPKLTGESRPLRLEEGYPAVDLHALGGALPERISPPRLYATVERMTGTSVHEVRRRRTEQGGSVLLLRWPPPAPPDAGTMGDARQRWEEYLRQQRESQGQTPPPSGMNSPSATGAQGAEPAATGTSDRSFAPIPVSASTPPEVLGRQRVREYGNRLVESGRDVEVEGRKAVRLRELRMFFEGWDEGQLGSHLKFLGIPTERVWLAKDHRRATVAFLWEQTVPAATSAGPPHEPPRPP